MSNETQLFSPFSIRSVTLPNRIVLSPLCMYSANSGMASSWQFAHLSTFHGAVFWYSPRRRRSSRAVNHPALPRYLDGRAGGGLEADNGVYCFNGLGAGL